MECPRYFYGYCCEDCSYVEAIDTERWRHSNEGVAANLFALVEERELIDQIYAKGMGVLEHIAKNCPDYPLDLFFTKYSHLEEDLDRETNKHIR